MHSQEGFTGNLNHNINHCHIMQEETSSNYSKKKPSKWNQNKMGAFWTKKKSNGNTFLSGNIVVDGNTIPICIFKNDFSDGKTPHFQAFRVTDQTKNDL